MKRCRGCHLFVDYTEIGSPAPKRMKIVSKIIRHMQSETSIVTTTTTNEEKIDASISKPIDIFGLNDDCLRKILEYCTIVDLYNLGMASDEFKTSIVTIGIRGRLIDFEELADCSNILDVFKMFGKKITNIKIGEKDIQYKARKLSKFDEILRLISTYCSVDTLKYLNLQYYHGTTIKKPLLYASLPFFRCIESFMIKEIDRHGREVCLDYFGVNLAFNPFINDFVERVIANATNINTIELHYLKITGRFFYAHQVGNLINLSLVGCNIREANGLISFLQEKPKLKSFTWNNTSLRGMDTNTSHSSNLVYELVASNIPDLAVLDYYPNESSIDDRNKFLFLDFSYMHPNFELIANFNKLKVLSFKPITLDCFKMLARKNTVEKLNGYIFATLLDTNLSFLDNYTNLKCIQLIINDDQKDLVINLLSKLPQLTDSDLFFHHIDDNADDVIKAAVESAINLSNLNISASDNRLSIDHMIALYSQLLEIRVRQGKFENPLTIHLHKIGVAKLVSPLGQNYRPDIIKVQLK